MELHSLQLLMYDGLWGIGPASLGLYLDILGAIGLARSFITKTVSDIVDESTSGWGGTATLAYSLIAQKVDAVIGGLFLVIGFFLQIVGNLYYNYNLKPIEICWPCVIMAALTIAIFYWFLLWKIGRRIANYIFLVMRFEKSPEGKRVDDFLKNLKEDRLSESQVYRVLSKQCNAGIKGEQSFEEYKGWLRQWVGNSRYSTLGWWPLRSRPVAWFIRQTFGA